MSNVSLHRLIRSAWSRTLLPVVPPAGIPTRKSQAHRTAELDFTAACSQCFCLQIQQDQAGVAAEGHPDKLEGLAAVQAHPLSASPATRVQRFLLTDADQPQSPCAEACAPRRQAKNAVHYATFHELLLSEDGSRHSRRKSALIVNLSEIIGRVDWQRPQRN